MPDGARVDDAIEGVTTSSRSEEAEERSEQLVRAPQGKWTVVDPRGRSRVYSSWSEVVAAPPGGSESIAPRSAAALLDLTPLPRSEVTLSSSALNDIPSRSDLPEAIPSSPSTQDLHDVSTREIETRGDDDDDDDEIHSKDVITAVPGEFSSPEIPAEAVSLRDMTVIAVHSSPPPAAPKAGELGTLPPTARLSVPPAPTIKVTPPANEGAPGSRSGWFLPAFAIIVVVGGAYFVLREPHGERWNSSAPAPPMITEPRSESTAETPPIAKANDQKASDDKASLGEAVPGPVSSQASAQTGAAQSPHASEKLALSEILKRASAARRSGDVVHAREWLERALAVSPENAEAYSGLGEVARIEGDLQAAHSYFERALAKSPRYVPALVGMADTQWELGQKDAARRNYRTVSEAWQAAPERIRERAGLAATSTEGTNVSAPSSPTPSESE